MAGSYFFIRVLSGTPWHLVAGGFPPVIVFVWLAGGATLLHLDRLNDSGLPLIAWVALYVVTPLLVPAIYLTNRSRARPSPAESERLAGGMRLLLGASGPAVLVPALVAFVSPETAIEAWPWPLTPLTMRVAATVFALYGTVGVTVALSGDAAGVAHPARIADDRVRRRAGRGAPRRVGHRLGDRRRARVRRRDRRAVGDRRRRATFRRNVGSAGRPRTAWTLATCGSLGLAALAGAALAMAISALGPSEREESGDPFSTALGPVPTNRVSARAPRRCG